MASNQKESDCELAVDSEKDHDDYLTKLNVQPNSTNAKLVSYIDILGLQYTREERGKHDLNT